MSSATQTISRLRQERERQEMSLRELAFFARVSHMTIQRLERGTLDVAPATRARIARTLRVRPHELWPTEDDEPARETGSSLSPPEMATDAAFQS